MSVSDDQQEKVEVQTHIVVIPDQDEVDFAEFRNARGISISLRDFPKPLRKLQRMLVNALKERRIKRFEFDSLALDPFQVDGQPFDFDVLGLEPMNNLLELTQWWIDQHQKRSVCQPLRNSGKHLRRSWTCECGLTVNWDLSLCSDSTCPSWEKMLLCTGKTIRTGSKSA